MPQESDGTLKQFLNNTNSDGFSEMALHAKATVLLEQVTSLHTDPKGGCVNPITAPSWPQIRNDIAIWRPHISGPANWRIQEQITGSQPGRRISLFEWICLLGSNNGRCGDHQAPSTICWRNKAVSWQVYISCPICLCHNERDAVGKCDWIPCQSDSRGTLQTCLMHTALTSIF